MEKIITVYNDSMIPVVIVKIGFDEPCITVQDGDKNTLAKITADGYIVERNGYHVHITDAC